MKKLLTLLILSGSSCLAQSQHGVDLSWGASPDTSPTMTYNVYRLNAVCPTTLTGFTKLNTTGITGLTFGDNNPAPKGTTLCYYITAVDNSLESVPSSTVQLVYLPPPFPPAPPIKGTVR